MGLTISHKYQMYESTNQKAFRKHTSWPNFVDLLIWDKDICLHSCNIDHTLPYNSGPNCKHTGLVAMLNMFHIYPNYNVSNCVACM